MDEKTTIFHGLLRSDLPDEEKSTGRLTEEAQLIVFAGTDTTGKFFILALPWGCISLKTVSNYFGRLHLPSTRQSRNFEEAQS